MVICHDTTRKKSPEKQNIQVFFRPSFDNSHLQPARWCPEKKSCGLSGISTHSSPLTWIYSRYNWTNFHMFVGDLPPFKLVLLDQRKTNFHFIWGWHGLKRNDWWWLRMIVEVYGRTTRVYPAGDNRPVPKSWKLYSPEWFHVGWFVLLYACVQCIFIYFYRERERDKKRESIERVYTMTCVCWNYA